MALVILFIIGYVLIYFQIVRTMPKKKKNGIINGQNRDLCYKDTDQLYMHFREVLDTIEIEDDVKMMQVRPQNCMPFSHKQIFIRQGNKGKQCKTVDSILSKCPNAQCPCHEFNTLNRDELKTLDSAVLKNRDNFITYLRDSYKDVFSPNFKLQGRLASGHDLEVLANLLANFILDEVEQGAPAWRCIRAFHALIPYINLCTRCRMLNIIELGVGHFHEFTASSSDYLFDMVSYKQAFHSFD